jgi:hypothetical protein
MTQQEHKAQHDLVALSLLLCPLSGTHRGKGHDSKSHDRWY